MSATKKLDLTKTHSLEAAAEWIRERSGALIVVVLREGDGVLAVDPAIDVLDVHDRLWDRDLPRLLGRLREIRTEAAAELAARKAKAAKKEASSGSR